MTTEKTKATMATGTPNNPNAKILISAMQHLGYDNFVAICDIIDNSIDAEATKINIYVSNKNDNFQIVIQDNGCGMDYETLDEALKFGSDTSHDEMSDLGKYGMGLSTAGLSLADKTTVFTKKDETFVVLKSMTDVNVIKQENAFVKYLGEASEQERTFFYSMLGDAVSGTIVILEDCYGVKNKNVTQFANRLIKEIARKYRKFMNSVEFHVNDKPVQADDPLMLSGVEKDYIAEIYSDDDYEVSWMDKETGCKKTGKIHAKLVLLPDTSQEKAKALGINIPNQGFSVLRNNREIAFGFMPWYTKHNSQNRIRGEISFDSSLDEAMGVNFTKNNIDMIDAIDDALRAALKPQITAMRNRIAVAKKASGEEITSHIEAEEAINKKSKVLITPPAKKETRTATKTKDAAVIMENIEVSPENALEEEKRKERMPKKYQGANANVRFENMHYSQNGPMFDAVQEGKTIVIRWNVDHPFYARFVRENADNKTLVTSVDFLIYSLAAAQIQAIGEDEDKAQMIENIISTMSINMKVLLS